MTVHLVRQVVESHFEQKAPSTKEGVLYVSYDMWVKTLDHHSWSTYLIG